MLRPRGAVHEVPGAKRSLLAFDDEHTLSGQDEEVLLSVLPVVHATQLAGQEQVDVDPEVREARVRALERSAEAELTSVEPACVSNVEDEPALARRDEPGIRLLERASGTMASRLVLPQERNPRARIPFA
jgi:broad specificity phosphatase PhoE